jgi:uncharacterized membrane protein
VPPRAARPSTDETMIPLTHGRPSGSRPAAATRSSAVTSARSGQMRSRLKAPAKLAGGRVAQPMDFRRIASSEIVAAVGGLLLAIGIFLPWYSPNQDNRNANVGGVRDAVSAWDYHSILRWLLLAAALAPIILLWIVIRDHELSWPRGEMTAVVGIIAFGLVAYVGIIDRPGEPSGQIGLGIGWILSFLGTILIAIGGSIRASTSERPRKPPGVL